MPEEAAANQSPRSISPKTGRHGFLMLLGGISTVVVVGSYLVKNKVLKRGAKTGGSKPGQAKPSKAELRQIYLEKYQADGSSSAAQQQQQQ